MKRIIVANRREVTNTVSSNNHNELREKLFDDLSLNFEDNIVMRYAKYVKDDAILNYDDARYLVSVLNSTREKYLDALAEVIEQASAID